MGNYVTAGVGNYVIANPSNLGNFMIADTFLAVTAATERAKNPTPPGTSLIALTCSEIKRLFNTFITKPLHHLPHRLHWSILSLDPPVR